MLTLAKCDLEAGTEIDEIGGFHTFGQLDNSRTVLEENLLPQGLARGCVLKRNVTKDSPLTFDDVVLPEGRLIDKLYQDQIKLFG